MGRAGKNMAGLYRSNGRKILAAFRDVWFKGRVCDAVLAMRHKKT